MEQLTIPCDRCGPVVPVVVWQTFTTDPPTRHLRATCPRCHSFLKFLEQTPENVALALPEPGETPGLFDAV